MKISEYVTVKLQMSSNKGLEQEQPHCSGEEGTEAGFGVSGGFKH